jgi:hypothetical protein
MVLEIFTYRTISIILIFIAIVYVTRFWWSNEGKSKATNLYEKQIKPRLSLSDSNENQTGDNNDENNENNEENTSQNNSNGNRASTKDLPKATLYTRSGCKFCENLKPEWELFASNPNVDAYEFNCDTMRPPSDIEGFPTVIFEDGDKRVSFVGPQTERQLVEFLYNEFFQSK